MRKVFFMSPSSAFFVFATITLISLFICRDVQFGESQDSRYMVFSIRFEYFGMDASELERTITIPLEEKIEVLSGLYEIRSSTEYSKTLTTIYFDRSVDEKNTYLALRDIVDTLYNTLPQAVQKPRIYFAGSDQKAVLSLACMSEGSLNTLRKYIENNLKKEFERIDGVAEVIITGGTIDEIRIEFDPDRVTEIGMNPAALGSIMQDANVVSPGGILYGITDNKTVLLDTKIRSLDQIKRLPVKAGEEITSLEYFADINIFPRESDEIVRINGRECIGIQIKASSNGNIIKISNSCKEILRKSNFPKDSVQILSDSGALFFSMIKRVLIAMLQSFIVLIIIIPFFFRTLRIMLLLIILLPINCIWTVAILHILKFSIDQNVLSGITISLGLIIDSALIIGSLAEKYVKVEMFIKSITGIMGAIFASAITTICVITPLYFLDYIVPGIKSVSVSITIMMLNSIILSCLFFPNFVFSGKISRSIIPSYIFNTIKRFYIRMSFKTSRFSIRNAKIMRFIYASCILSTFFIFFISGKNITLDVRDDVIYAAAEYEPERTGLSIDMELTAIADLICQEYGVKFLRMESRKGTAEFEIGFDKNIIGRKYLAERISNLTPYMKTGFLYIPDAGSQKNSSVQEIEIAVVGDETTTCREIARQGAAIVQTLPAAVQTVLNFKNPEKTVNFFPDRDTITKSNISVETIASTLRWFMFGPVVDKWIQNNNETDIRIAGKGLKNTTLSHLTNIYIPSDNDGIRLDTLGTFEITDGTGKIYRRDGRRAAYFTVHINASSTNKAIKTVKEALNTIETEKGYGFLLPRELELLEKQYRLLLFAFIGSIIAILLLLTALTENFLHSLIITSIIPVSCVLPLLIKFITHTPLEMGDIVGMVIISGIGVNNAIYIAESKKSNTIFRIREKIQSILVTSLTSIAAAIPLALTSSDGFSSTLALSILLGTVGSLISSVILFPSVFNRSNHE